MQVLSGQRIHYQWTLKQSKFSTINEEIVLIHVSFKSVCRDACLS